MFVSNVVYALKILLLAIDIFVSALHYILTTNNAGRIIISN